MNALGKQHCADIDRYGELISAWLDDELDDDAALELREHLDHCPDCQRIVGQFRAVENRLELLCSTAKTVPRDDTSARRRGKPDAFRPAIAESHSSLQEAIPRELTTKLAFDPLATLRDWGAVAAIVAVLAIVGWQAWQTRDIGDQNAGLPSGDSITDPAFPELVLTPVVAPLEQMEQTNHVRSRQQDNLARNMSQELRTIRLQIEHTDASTDETERIQAEIDSLLHRLETLSAGTKPPTVSPQL